MRRREFLALGSAAMAWPLAARAQQLPAPVIGFLSSGSAEARAALTAAFRRGLSETGYIEGQNIAIEFRWAEDRYDRLPALAADLVRIPVSVMAAMTLPGALAAKAATATIPIVFFSGGDPVEEGLVPSLSRPNANVTGVSLFINRLGAKRLELMHELAPGVGAFGFLVNPDNQNAAAQVRDAQEAARGLGLAIYVVNATREADLPAGFAMLSKQRVRGLIVGADPFFRSSRNGLIALAAKQRIPAIYYDREYAADGGLISYGNRLDEAYHDVGVYIGKILKGTKPAELPVVQPTKFELVINLKTAKALGLAIPATLLARADEVIE